MGNSLLERIREKPCPHCNPHYFEHEIIHKFLLGTIDDMIKYVTRTDVYYQMTPYICDECHNTYWVIIYSYFLCYNQTQSTSFSIPNSYHEIYKSKKDLYHSELTSYIPDVIKEYFIALLMQR